MASISASVGSYESGAANDADDVRTVQKLLREVAREQRMPALDPGTPDGKIARTASRSGTVAAITNFQRDQVGLNRPDQRIDVDGRTWRKLVALADTATRPATPVAPPAPAAAVRPITLTVEHGGKIPTGTKFKVKTSATVTGPYESTFTLSGGLAGTFTGSIYPNDMTVKGHLVDGAYPLHLGFHKGGGKARQGASKLVVAYTGIRPALLVNARRGVKVKSDDPKKTESHGVNVHNGQRSGRSSDGCPNIPRDEWDRFIRLFLDAFPDIKDWHALYSNTGKKIGELVVKK